MGHITREYVTRVRNGALVCNGNVVHCSNAPFKLTQRKSKPGGRYVMDLIIMAYEHNGIGELASDDGVLYYYLIEDKLVIRERTGHAACAAIDTN